MRIKKWATQKRKNSIVKKFNKQSHEQKQIHLKNSFHIFITSFVLLFIVGCKSSQTLVSSGEVANISVKNIIKNHYRNAVNFNTIRGKLKVDFDNGQEQDNFTLSLRMEKDKNIWISAKLGVVKILITPRKVSFYNKLDNTYFEGDFAIISKFLGTQLDFDKIQNLLVGEALFNLKSERFNSQIVDKTYALTPKRDLELFKRLFFLDAFHFKVKKQQLAQEEENRLLTIEYPTYQEITGQPFPQSMEIKAEEIEKTTTIAVEYKKVTFNENVRFPFKIPSGYREIKI
jgi:outer membrane biogenesis lipoprotein LolB